MSTEYETKSNKLSEFFSDGASLVFKIPPYQRGYSWKSEQVEDFINDVFGQLDDLDQYYFGTITVIDKGSHNGIRMFDLIDGQQRITTSIIFLICIRDIFYELNSEHKTSIEEDIFNTELEPGDDEYYKLILDYADDMFFRDHILKKLPRDQVDKLKDVPVELESHLLLKNAYQKIRKEITEKTNGMDRDGKISFLNRLRTTLKRKFIISMLTLTKPNKAYTLFNRMNDRGLNLAPADLAKDLILSLVNQENDMTEDNAIKKWRVLEEKTSKRKYTLNNYIYHYLTTFHSSVMEDGKEIRRIIQKNKMFDELEHVLGIKTDKKSPKRTMTGSSLLQELFDKFTNYEALIKYGKKHPNKSPAAIDNMQWINKLGIHIVYPVLMAGIEQYSKDDFTKLSDILLKWFFRLKTVANRNASGLEKDLVDITHRMMNIDPELGRRLTFQDVKKELRDLDISRAVFEECVKELSLGENASKYFLTKIIESEQGKEVTDLTPPKLLEHIMPHNPEKEHTLDNGHKFTWMEYIQETNSKPDKRDAKSFHQNYKNRLGNLTLIDRKKNSKFGTVPFYMKRKLYEQSQIEITKSIAGYDKWSETDIKNRQEKLASKATKIWEI